MHCTYFTPHPALAPFVETYYLVEGDFGSGTPDTFFADGCPEIVINHGVTFDQAGQADVPAKLIGQITEPLHVTARGKGRSFGIWLRPQGLASLTGIAANELTDGIHALADVIGEEIGQRLHEALALQAPHALVPLADQVLLQLLRQGPQPRRADVVRFAERRLHTLADGTTVRQLATECGVSLRYLQQLFREQVGLRPKQYQRILRFRQSLALVDGDTLSLSDVAHQTGFADQPHFTREFARFTETTPRAYRRRRKLLTGLYRR